MEAFRQKRSKTAATSLAYRSSSAEGNRQVQKQSNFPKLAADSSSCSSGATYEDSLTFELGWRSSKPAIGTPMKKLLAEEMSRETESKRRSPSVIARLMGLDGLPPQQPAHKQQKMSLENYQRKVLSVDKAQWSGPISGRRSFRKSSKDEQEFKDVFEVLETSKTGSSSSSFRESKNSKLTEAEMAFIRQKFMDAKRLSTDEKLQESKEFHDALEALDSNKDLLVKFLQQPDSLFTKHLHDLQGASPQSHCGRVAAMKSSDSPKYESSGLGLKPEREAALKNHRKYPQKHHNSLSSHSYNGHASCNSLKSSKIQLEEKCEPAVAPTRIVVLKPNLGKAQNVAKAVPSQHSSHAFPSDSRKHTELPGIRNRETELLGKRIVSDDVGHSRHKSIESRDIAKQITRQMRNSFSTGSVKFSSSGCRGYAGDESSCTMSGNDSTYDSEASAVTSRNSFDWTNRDRASSSRSTESSVSREARKRLSERWKMTHKSQEVGVSSRGSTLGEMLAIPDKETRAANLMVSEERFRDKFARDDGPSGWVEPLGISSRDGWKDGCITNFSRSRSLPTSSAAFGSPKTSRRRETVCDDRYLIPKEALKRERNKVVKGNYGRREGSRPRSSRSTNKKLYTRGRDSDPSAETNFSQNQAETKLEEKDPSIQNLAVSDLLASISVDTSSILEIVVDIGQDNAAISSESPDRELPAHMLLKDNSSAGDLENHIPQELSKEPSEEVSVPLHHPVPDLESPASSKEADQPSPLSVLEAPFTDDLSSGSECFESLNADLNGLRMQLQLLKLESDSYVEGSMIVSSDEDVREESIGLGKVDGIWSSGNWESSYIRDVLFESGFSNADPDMFVATSHSPECPVNPSVFEELEKKYCDQTSWLRSDRRLLFDRINSGLLEIYRKYADTHPWASTATTCRVLKWTIDGLEGSLCKLLADEEQKAKNDAMEKVLARESEWLDFGDDIRVIGREVERLLIDELVTEVVVAI